MYSKVQIRIILDDGGGMVLVVWRDKYAHYYDYADQLAEDIILLRDGETTTSWDNNEWGTGISFSDSSCRVYQGTPQQVIKEILKDYRNDDIYGNNHIELAKTLKNIK